MKTTLYTSSFGEGTRGRVKVKAILFSLFLPFFISTTTYSQPINTYANDVVQPSAEAQIINKFIESPVNLYTGTISPGIMIHQLSQGPLSTQVRLQYHLGGVTLEELASNVGLSWALIAGGSVNRVVNDLRDDDILKGYFYKGNSLPDNANNLTQSQIDQLMNEGIDGEADLFTFSAGGYSAKFYFNKQKQPIIIDRQDIVVQLTEGIAQDHFESFIIITPDGNRHHFGKYGSQTAYDYTWPTASSSDKYISTWHLIRTETHDERHAINYTYEAHNYSFTSSATCSMIATNCNASASSNSLEEDCGSAPEFQFGTKNFAFRTTNIEGQRIKTVETDHETVTFIYNTIRDDLSNSTATTTDKKMLDEIQISTGSYCHKFVLSHSYFVDTGHELNGSVPVPAAKRLRLDAVQEIKCTGPASGDIPPYTFTYDTSKELEWRHSKQIDHHGYWNGKINNDGLTVNVPNTTVLGNGYTATYGSADRSTDTTYSRVGSLKRMDFPSGGHESYITESHSVKGTVTIDTIIFEKTSCGTPGTQQCCDIDGNLFTKTFTATELVGNRLDLWIDVLQDSGFCNNNFADVHLFIHPPDGMGGVGPAIFSEGFNISTTSPPNKVTMTYDSTFFTAMQPGVEYTFSLVGNDGWRGFEFYSSETTTADIPIGGLRIKQVTLHDNISTSNDQITQYEYLADDGFSSGLELSPKIYGHYAQGYGSQLNNGQWATLNTFIFTSTNHVPGSTYEGTHIGYAKVKTFQPGNGYTENDYYVGFGQINYSFSFPFPPRSIRPENGNITTSETYKEGSSTPIATTTNIKSTDNFRQTPTEHMYRKSREFKCNSGNSGSVFFNQYNIPIDVYKVGTLIQTTDGVSTTTDISYDPQQAHLFPVKECMTNSDGAIHCTESYYSDDYSAHMQSEGLATSSQEITYADSIQAKLLRQNRWIPWKSIQTVERNSTVEIVDGSIQQMGLFDSLSSGIYIDPLGYNNFLNSTSTPAAGPYPYESHRKEVTWNATNTKVDNGWISQNTKDKYDPTIGYPIEISHVGWNSPIELEFSSSGQITEEKYESYIKNWTYHTNTDLLSSISNIDKTSSTYSWDQYQRPTGITTNCLSGQGFLSTQLIFYLEPISTLPRRRHVRSTYPKFGGTTITSHTIDNYEYYDGINRVVQTNRADQSPEAATDDIITSITYDHLGNPTHTYEPRNVTGSTSTILTPSGDFTLSGYEVSPLKRSASILPPSWHTTTTTYGANATGEVKQDHNTNTYYAANSLYKTTVTDPEGLKTETFTDKRGRVVLTRVTDDTNEADTYRLYDDKDRETTIIPPDALLTDTELIYTKLYSGEDNIITQKDADKAAVQKRYDDRNLLTHLQDGEMLTDSRWYSMEYDTYGQVIKEGWASTETAPISEVLIENLYGTADGNRGKLIQKRKRILNGANAGITIQEDYEHDACGRLVVTRSNSVLYPAIGSIVDSLILDDANNVIEQYTKVTPIDLQIRKRYTYDDAGRKLKCFVQVTSDATTFTEQEVSDTEYTIKEQVEKLTLGGGLQTLDYDYLDNRLLANINDVFNLGNDLIAIRNEYNTDATKDNVIWKHTSQGNSAYSYDYDYLKRITNAQYLGHYGNNAFNASYTFKDDRGNFDNITRMSHGSTLHDMDFTHYLGTNQIQSISGPASLRSDKEITKSSSSTFQWNDNGTLENHPLKNITVDNNFLNLPNSITVPDSSGQVVYSYDSEGVLHQTSKYKNGSLISTKHYLVGGMIEYHNEILDQIHLEDGFLELEYSLSDEVYRTGTETNTTQQAMGIHSDATVPNNNTVIYEAGQFVRLNEGFEVVQGADFEADIIPYSVTGVQYFYHITDDMDNRRVLFSDLDGNGSIATNEVLGRNDLYPYGKRMDNGLPSFAEKFRYSTKGHERQGDFSLDIRRTKFRLLDDDILTWYSPDPLQTLPENISNTSYLPMQGNPGIYTDEYGDNPITLLARLAKTGKRAYKLGKRVVKQVRSGRPLRGSLRDAGRDLLIDEGIDLVSGANPTVGTALRATKDAFDVVDGKKLLKKNPFLKQTKAQNLKSKKKYENLVKEHQQKIDDFKKDPIGNTSPEKLKQMTKDNPSHEILLERAKGRIHELESQLNKQQGELIKINEALKKGN